MSEEKNKKQNKRKSSTKKSSKSKENGTGATRKRSQTRKKKTDVLEAQQSWKLEENVQPADGAADEPAEPAAPSEDNSTKEISIEDYQPIIWASDTKDTSEDPDQDNTTPDPDQDTSSKQQGDSSDADAKETEAASGGSDIRTAAPASGSAASKIAGAVFVGVLVLMLVMNFMTKDVLYSDQENRVFQQMPKFSVGNYLAGRFESQLDNYVSDQFAWRNAFIKIKSSADLTIGQIKANGVFKARDSYLMEDITWPDKASNTADVDSLRKFKKKYHGKKMYFMLVPNAANILKDKLPAGVVTHDQNADMDRLFKSVKKIGYTPIDVRKDLTKASKDKQVYYRTDHHWTTDGAYVAYQKAAKVMKLKSKIKYKENVVKRDFIGTLYSKSGFTNGRKDAIKIYLPAGDKYLNSVIRYKDKKEKTTMYYDMANLDIKDAYTVFGGTNQSLITISTPTKENKHLLVVKDSYANCFIPFLTQDYRTITIVDPRYYYENIATVMKADEIDEVLFLYNANTFFSDNYMRMMLTNR